MSNWKDAVLDECAIACIPVHDTDTPRDVIQRLCQWHVDVALDPRVSKDAEQLRDTYKPHAEAMYERFRCFKTSCDMKDREVLKAYEQFRQNHES